MYSKYQINQIINHMRDSKSYISKKNKEIIDKNNISYYEKGGIFYLQLDNTNYQKRTSSSRG